MFSLLNPIDNPRDFDVVTIAGVDTPGLARVSEPNREYEWDIKVGKGAWGTTTTFTGRKPAQFSIDIEIGFGFSREQMVKQFRDWESLVNKLQYDPTKIKFNFDTLYISGVNAVDVFYPTLVQAGINSIVIMKLRGLTHKGKGLWTCGIDCLEWFPPPRLTIVATPAGSTDVPGVQFSDKVTAKQNEISGLLDTFKKGLATP